MNPILNTLACPDTKCSKCGKDVIKDNKFYDCICSFLRTTSMSFLPSVWKGIIKSKFDRKFIENKIIKSPLENYYIRTDKPNLLRLIKAVVLKYRMGSWKILSDHEIVMVWLEKGSSTENISEKDGKQSLYNSVVPHKILIVLAGQQKSKNCEAANVLWDALKMRENAGRPTWFVAFDDARWDKSSPSWSEDLEGYLEDNYEYINLLNDGATEPVKVQVRTSNSKPKEPKANVKTNTQKSKFITFDLGNLDDEPDEGIYGVGLDDSDDRDRAKRRRTAKARREID